jgi:hypothetical protein
MNSPIQSPLSLYTKNYIFLRESLTIQASHYSLFVTPVFAPALKVIQLPDAANKLGTVIGLKAPAHTLQAALSLGFGAVVVKM